MEYNNSRRNIVTPLLFAVALVIGILVGISLDRANMRNRLRDMNFSTNLSDDKLSTMLSLIQTQYVDDVQMDSIAEKVIPTLLENLDPHSVYIPAMDLAEVNEPLEGQFDGIGVTFNMMTDTVLVLNVIPGGPSAKAGIMNGDRIMTINDSLVAGKKIAQNDIVKKLRGPRGSKVNLGIKRSGVKSLVPITVTRGVIPVKSIDAAFMADRKTGYIKLSRFSRNSHEEMMRAVKQLQSEGMRDLIFDLRENTGGFLDQAILIANEFLPDKSLIVYTEGKSRKRTDQYSDGKGRLQEVNVAILIDEGSASASEIVAGALQDNDRGTIIGRRSFGKGLVQEQIPFIDGSAVRLTVARYYTPVGRSIQKPYDKGVEAYNNDLMDRYNHAELFSADSIHFPDSLKFTTPKGKVVYGGGGIMPDIFVPIDTTGATSYLRELWGRNILLKYTFEYADLHRKELNDIKSIKQLNAYFAKQDRLVDDFVTYAASKGISPKGNELQQSRQRISAELKAYIGRNTALEDNGFYPYIFPEDNVIIKTLDFFQ